MVGVGEPAPDFTLKNQHGEDVTLSALRGRPVVLVFIPFAFSSICTSELAELRDDPIDGVEVLAISCDHMFSNRAFADAQNLEFSLLSDFWPHGEVSRAYGVFSAELGVPERGTYVVDPAGTVRWTELQGIGERRDLGRGRAALAALV